ncbi:MAG: glycosyltransferase family 39 protein [Flavobacteriales bacterium]|nr:glycosyltransferase family 39 protein [Flavobacteriales bacterium]
MRNASMTVLITAVTLLVIALGAGLLSRASFTSVRGYLDTVAPDGEVEHYTPAMHEGATRNAGWAAWIAGTLGVLLLSGRRMVSRRVRSQGPAWATFKADAWTATGRSRRGKDDDQRMWVFLLIGIGAVLRIWQLGAPVIYDEAFTYTYYASRPISVILSDYSYPNNHILHTLLVKLSTAVFGVGLWQIRLPALLAGIAMMPLCYLFVRAMFNRYIALMTLALVAASGCLIEYSALGRGYSLTWFFFMAALVAGRHFVKTNNAVSAVAVGICCALGMWTVPTMIYPALTVYLWLMFYLSGKYESSLRQRVLKLVLSFVVFVLLTGLFYSPVLVVYGLPQLTSHPELGVVTWEMFAYTHQDKSFDFWVHVVDTSSTWVAFAGFAGIIYAAFITSKFRKLFIAMALGTVPLVILQMNVAPPRTWYWTLIVFHISSAVALFYLLKFIQEKLAPRFQKNMRTVIASMFLVVFTGILSMTSLPRGNDLPRYPEAALAAEYLATVVQPGDLVLMQFPWEAPIEFSCLAEGIDRDRLHVPGNARPVPGTRLFVLLSPASSQTPATVLQHYVIAPETVAFGTKLKDWMRLEIHGAVVR